jgi:hypothetical protein
MVLSTTIRNLALQVLEQYLPIRLPYTAVLFLVGWGWGSLLSAGELSHASDLVVGIGPGKLVSQLSECFARSTSGHMHTQPCMQLSVTTVDHTVVGIRLVPLVR